MHGELSGHPALNSVGLMIASVGPFIELYKIG